MGIAAPLLVMIAINQGRDGALPLADDFRSEVARIAPLAGVTSKEQWFTERAELQRRMLEMLGLWPLPPRSDLKPRVTRVTERSDFVVENVLFQSMPGLYVTGNLYRPKDVKAPAPAILYVCGHSKVEKDGVIYGNKAHYQHHAAWFAANGYVCLVIDTLQLGELPGVHHGMYREGRWWWQSRGYTPAGVEAWNAVRALDYLETRPEVDTLRLGVTGRSGGGATSWWLGAIDDRLAAVAPVAGITDLADHVINAEATGHYKNGVVEGHCDCMYIHNTYRWDYDAVAALVAPKPLLIENTDADSIFPLAGVKRIHERVAKVYDWYGVPERLSLVIGKGGHDDSVELRHAAFAFFEKHLKGRDVAVADIEEPDRKVPIELLKVLQPGEVPADCRNATIDESFVPARTALVDVKDADAWDARRNEWLAQLRAKTFGGWPAASPSSYEGLKIGETRTVRRAGVVMTVTDVETQPGVTCRIWTHALDGEASRMLTLRLPDWRAWNQVQSLFDKLDDADSNIEEDPGFLSLKEGLKGRPLAAIAVRGLGATAWADMDDTHIQRRFWLLGQTLEGMRAWDVRCAIAALQQIRPTDHQFLGLFCSQSACATGILAAAFEPDIRAFLLDEPPTSFAEAPAFLNVQRIIGLQEALGLLAPRKVMVSTKQPDAWVWDSNLGRVLGVNDWPSIVASDDAAR